MRNYEDLVKSLRYCAEYDCTTVCPRAGTGNGCITRLKKEAADAIEELSRENKSLADTVNKADEIIRNRGGKWISVEERLPDSRENVLTLTSDCDVYICEYIPTVKQFWSIPGDELHIDDITHWMLLPELPDEEQK